MFRVFVAGATILALVLPSTVLAQAFTLNDLAVLRVGDGTTTLVNTGGPISIQDITRTGTVTNTVNITSTGVSGLQVSGNRHLGRHLEHFDGSQFPGLHRLQSRRRRVHRNWLPCWPNSRASPTGLWLYQFDYR